MARHTLDDFVPTTAKKDRGQGFFELESDHLLAMNLDGLVWTKRGSMVAYQGEITFTREGILEHGLGRMLKKAFTREGTWLTKAEGYGRLYLADCGKKVSILNLNSQSIYVDGNDLLAFQPGIAWDIKPMRRGMAMLAGGPVKIRLEGTGLIAITTHCDPLTLRVTPNNPVMTDPHATVAWSGTLQRSERTDGSLKTSFSLGSGESTQMLFRGDGFVVVQPYEEVYCPFRARSGF